MRNARTARQLSLSDVADEADVSIATLSRIENEKQSINVELLVRLAEIVGASAGALLDRDDEAVEPRDLARELAECSPADRAEILVRAARHRRSSKGTRNEIHSKVEGLLATVDLMIDEIDDLRKSAKRRR